MDVLEALKAILTIEDNLNGINVLLASEVEDVDPGVYEMSEKALVAIAAARTWLDKRELVAQNYFNQSSQ